MPDAVFLVFFTYKPLRTILGLSSLLTSIEEIASFRPTHWGLDERILHPYNPDIMKARISELKGEFQVPVLRRKNKPRYEAFFHAKSQGLCKIDISFGSVTDETLLEKVFTLGDILANALQPELGWVHPIWRLGDESQKYTAAGILDLQKLQEFGIKPVCARTWYGHHIIKLIGRDTLDDSGAIVQDTSWGGTQIDLVEQPSRSSFEALKMQQEKVMRRLISSGVYGDFSKSLFPVAAPRWVPFAEPSLNPESSIVKPMAYSPAEALMLERLQKASVDRVKLPNLIDIADMNLSNADLTNLWAGLLNAERAVLNNALLTGARIAEANLEYAKLNGAHMDNISLVMATLKHASLQEASLCDALLDLSFCDEANFVDADLTSSSIEDASFYRANLRGAVLKNVSAGSCFFKEANLQNADLSDGSFVNANFNGADLTGADLTNADCTGVDFSNAKIQNTIFHNANLKSARFSTDSSVNNQ